MRKKAILIIALLVFILLIFFVTKTGWLKINVDSSENLYPREESTNINNPENTENPETNVNLGGSTDEDSSGGTSDSSTSEEGCEMLQISYSLKNFASNQICLEESGGVCVMRQINCTIDVYNLDEISGEFELNLVVFEESNYNEIESLIISKNVMSEKHENLFWSFNIESQGIEGNANKELGCSFETSSVPKKEVC